MDELLNEDTFDRLRHENPKLADAVDQLGYLRVWESLHDSRIDIVS